MDLGYRNHLLAANGPAHSTAITPSDLRTKLPRPPPPVAEHFDMEKTPVTAKRRGGSRKACNECKQQKVSDAPQPMNSFTHVCTQLRCDIVQTPAAACSRCHRLGIDCKVEQSFKRISKRRLI